MSIPSETAAPTGLVLHSLAPVQGKTQGASSVCPDPSGKGNVEQEKRITRLRHIQGEAIEFVKRLRKEAVDRGSRVQDEIEKELGELATWLRGRRADCAAVVGSDVDLTAKQLADVKVELDSQVDEKAGVDPRIISINMLKQKAMLAGEELLKRATEDSELLASLRWLRKDAERGVLSRLRTKATELRDLTRAVAEQMEAIKRQLVTKFELQQECEELRRQKKEQAKEFAKRIDCLGLGCRAEEGRLDGLRNEAAAIEKAIRDRKDDLKIIESSMQAQQDLMKTVCEIAKRRYSEQRAPRVADPPPEHILHFYDPKTCYMYIYNLKSRKVFPVGPKELSIYRNHDSVQIGNRIFVHGGLDPATALYGRETFRIELIEDQDKVSIKQLSSANVPRSQHTLVVFDADTIYAVAGRNQDEKCLKVCERFGIVANSWSMAPPLNEKKILVAGTALFGVALYVFGGFTDRLINTVETLRPREETGWTMIKLKGEWKARHEMGCFQRGEDEIVLFGGIDSDKGGSEEVLLFSQKRGTIEKTAERLKKGDWFQMRTPVKHEEKVYVVGQLARDIHVYDQEKRTWDIVEEKDWEIAKVGN